MMYSHPKIEDKLDDILRMRLKGIPMYKVLLFFKIDRVCFNAMAKKMNIHKKRQLEKTKLLSNMSTDRIMKNLYSQDITIICKRSYHE